VSSLIPSSDDDAYKQACKHAYTYSDLELLQLAQKLRHPLCIIFMFFGGCKVGEHEINQIHIRWALRSIRHNLQHVPRAPAEHNLQLMILLIPDSLC
jgi:hypothetical protein